MQRSKLLKSLRSTLARLVAGDELDKLDRYRLACTEIERWLASYPHSAETAKWVRAFGEGYGALDTDTFRDRMKTTPSVTNMTITEKKRFFRTIKVPE